MSTTKNYTLPELLFYYGGSMAFTGLAVVTLVYAVWVADGDLMIISGILYFIVSNGAKKYASILSRLYLELHKKSQGTTNE